MRDLAELVQSLPPELYGEILDLTLTPDSNVVIINKRYRPPAQLQVSQACRETFQARYYENTAFALEDWWDTLLRKWARSLTGSVARKAVCVYLEAKPATLNSKMEEVGVCRPWVSARKGARNTGHFRYSFIEEE